LLAEEVHLRMGKSFGLLMQTMPYIIIRAAAYPAFGLISILYWVMIAISRARPTGRENSEGFAWVFVILIIVALGGFFDHPVGGAVGILRDQGRLRRGDHRTAHQ
jgi:hypothetical protein